MEISSALLPREYLDVSMHSLNARGIYNPLRFVVALRPDIEALLASIDGGAALRRCTDGKAVEAFSVYFHETIHWWQHIGSTVGLILSISYPAQSHCSLDELRHVLRLLGPKKSLVQWDSTHAVEASEETELHKNINVVLNNWHDLQFYRRLVIDPRAAQQVVGHRYFESSGHSYYLAYAHVGSLIGDAIGTTEASLVDPQFFMDALANLKQAGREGYAYGSKEVLMGIGARQIFEGQACLSQLQYLCAASSGKIVLQDFLSAGMLHGVYLEALDAYLKVMEEALPCSPFDPLIALFLLICDISINPYEGFPMEVFDAANFRERADPGFRFYFCCHAARELKDQLLSVVEACDSTAYWRASQMLCDLLDWPSPAIGLRRLCDISQDTEAGRALLEEGQSFELSERNLPVRLLLARHLSFSIDKSRNPQFFCWPGYWSSEYKASRDEATRFVDAFVEHESLFRLKSDGAVYPRIFPGKNQAALYKAFNDFYAFSMLYEAIDDWVMCEGDWAHDWSWLSAEHERREVIDAVDRLFRNQFQVGLADFEILQSA